MTEQTAGEHHTGTLNLTGEGNAPEQVVYYCPTAREIEQQPGGGFDVCCHAPELHEPILAGAYAAIRQQVAEEIASAITQAGDERSPDRHHEDDEKRDHGSTRYASYLDAASIARKIGDRA